MRPLGKRETGYCRLLPRMFAYFEKYFFKSSLTLMALGSIH